MVYITCILWGCLVGTVCTILFFQSDKSWLKIASSILGISGTGYSYTLVKHLTGETELKVLQCAFAIVLTAIFVSAFLILFALCKSLKDKEGNEVIRIRDILLGQKDYIKSFYQLRLSEVEEDSNTKILEKEKKEIEALRAGLAIREKNLNDREEQLNEQIKHNISLCLPVDSPIPMTNEFLGQFPEFIEGLAKFINDVNRFTEEYLAKEIKDNRDKYKLIYSYFLGICSFMMEDIFNTTAKNVRIHFRVLHNDEYVKFVAKIGSSVYEDELTPIPRGRGMIKEAQIHQTSLIKSLNMTHNFRSKHRNVWEDYMTMTFCEICKEDIPFISMGISVKNKERFKNLLYFLNFYKIENFIQDNLCKINVRYNIVDTIEAQKQTENGRDNS